MSEVPDRGADIMKRLATIEAEAQVHLLYACESGSRTWGFASRDSDGDVRFLYVHPPVWYLSIAERRDVIERSIVDDLDFSGWELRNGNLVIHEWLSRIVYHQAPGFVEAIRPLAEAACAPRTTLDHYLHMARGNWRDYLNGETVRRKKYLYALRPVLACLWLERGLGRPPVAFAGLAGCLSPRGPSAACHRRSPRTQGRGRRAWARASDRRAGHLLEGGIGPPRRRVCLPRASQ